MDRKIEKKKFTTRKIVIWGVSTLLLAFIIYNFFINSQGSRLKVERDKLSIAKVIKDEFREFISVDGLVMPIKTIRLDAIEGGVVEKKYYEGGILVDQGDTILKLSNNDLLQNFVREETQAFILVNDLENTKLSLKRNQFELRRTLIELGYDIEEAKDAYERGKQLISDKIISEQEFLKLKRTYHRLVDSRVIQIESAKFDSLNARLQIAQAETTLKRTRENLKMIKKNLDNLFIKAPIAGQLSTVNAEVGESIASGQNIGQIDDLNGFKIRAAIDEHYIARIYTGLMGSFSFDNKDYNLVITKVYPEVNNGSFAVDMAFENTEAIPSGIRRGQTLQTKLQLSENISAIQIPRGSFYQVTGGNWVFVLNADGTEATKRTIKLGRQNPRYYEVVEGLQPGEQVIVSGYDGYEDKDKLVIN